MVSRESWKNMTLWTWNLLPSLHIMAMLPRSLPLFNYHSLLFFLMFLGIFMWWKICKITSFWSVCVRGDDSLISNPLISMVHTEMRESCPFKWWPHRYPVTSMIPLGRWENWLWAVPDIENFSYEIICKVYIKFSKIKEDFWKFWVGDM